MNQVVTQLFVDARGAEAGSAAYVRAMQVAQQAVDRLRDREQALSAASASNQVQMLAAATSVTRTATAYDRLKASIDPVFAAAKGLERDLVTLDRAVTRLGISEAEQARMLDLIAAKHDQAAAAARRHAAAENVAIGSFGRRGINDNFAGANMAFQFQDVAMMAALGQSPIATALQQGPQIGAILQQGGGLSALASGLTSLINPTMLLSVGLTAASAAAIQFFTNTESEMDKASDALARHGDLISRLKDHYGEAAAGLKVYAGESSVILQADLARAREQYQQTIMTGARAALAEISSYSAESLGPQTPLFGPLQKSVNDLAASIERGRPALGSFIETLAKLEVSPHITETQKEVIRQLRDMEEAAAGVQAERALGGLGTLFDRNTDAVRRGAGAVDDYTQALQRLQNVAKPALSPLEEAEKAFGEIGNSGMGEADDAALREFNRARQRIREAEEIARLRESGGIPMPRPNDIERLDEGPSGADYIRSQRERIELLQLENQLIGETPAVRNAAIASLQLEHEIRRRGLDLYGEEARAMRENGRLEQSLAAVRAEAQRKEAEARREQIAAIERQRSDFRGFLGDLYQGIKAGDDFGDVLAKAGMNLADRLVSRQLDTLAEAAFPTAHLASMSPTAATIAIASLTEEPS